MIVDLPEADDLVDDALNADSRVVGQLNENVPDVQNTLPLGPGGGSFLRTSTGSDRGRGQEGTTGSRVEQDRRGLATGLRRDSLKFKRACNRDNNGGLMIL